MGSMQSWAGIIGGYFARSNNHLHGHIVVELKSRRMSEQVYIFLPFLQDISIVFDPRWSTMKAHSDPIFQIG